MKKFPKFGVGPVALIASIVIIAVVIFNSCYVIIGPGARGVVLDWGAAQKVIWAPGFHLKMPFKQTIIPISVRVQKKQSSESAASKDLQIVTTQVAVNFHLDPSAVNDIYQNVGTLAAVKSRVLDPAIANALKAVTAHYNADELVANRDKVRAEVAQQIRDSVKPYHVIVDAVNITNFAFSRHYNNAIEAKQVAQQRALQSKYELQRAQIDSQKQVVVAKANAEAAIETAKGQAQATIIGAKADAKAMMLRRKALSKKILELERLKRWNGVTPRVVLLGSGGNAMPLFDIGLMSKSVSGK